MGPIGDSAPWEADPDGTACVDRAWGSILGNWTLRLLLVEQVLYLLEGLHDHE